MDKYYFIEDSIVSIGKHLWYRLSSTLNKFVEGRLVAFHDREFDKMHRIIFG